MIKSGAVLCGIDNLIFFISTALLFFLPETTGEGDEAGGSEGGAGTAGDAHFMKATLKSRAASDKPRDRSKDPIGICFAREWIASFTAISLPSFRMGISHGRLSYVPI
jgi:hypothetical protein